MSLDKNYATLAKSPKGNTKTRRFPRINIKLPNNRFFNVVKDVINNKEIRNKVLVTLLIVVIYRTLSAIPLPGVDMTVYQTLFENKGANEANYLFTVFTGNRLETPSIIGLGLAAYINASIIMQLLPYVFGRLKALQEEGERGRQVLNQITRIITFPLAFIYSISYILLISQTDFASSVPGETSGNPLYLIPHAPGMDWPSMGKVVFMALMLAAGTVFLMWLSEIITEKGIGNGSSIVIMLGIISSLPGLVTQDLQTLDFQRIAFDFFNGNTGVLASPIFVAFVGVLIGLFLMIVAVVYVSESHRNVEIQYARRLRGDEIGKKSFLPIKFTVTGVMPVIFAYALLSIPQLIVPLVESGAGGPTDFTTSLRNSFLFAQQSTSVTTNTLIFDAIYFVLIVAFGVFYSFIVMNPKDTAENLNKSGGFVPGIRPGKSTENYIGGVLLRISFVGSIFLGLIALIPNLGRSLVLTSTGSNLALLSSIGGTSILIMVGVILDTRRQYASLRAARNYSLYARGE